MTDYALPAGRNGLKPDNEEPDTPRPSHTPPSLPHLLVASNLREIAARVKSGMATTHDASRLEALAIALDHQHDGDMAMRQVWPTEQETRLDATKHRSTRKETP
jgi:hypothetical protein